MHLQHIQIENIKNFRSGSVAVDLDFERPDGSLAGWTVLAGRNGAGKSTFLQAIAVTLAGPETARTLNESWASWVRAGAESASVGARIRIAELDTFVGGGRTPKRSFWAGLRWDASETGPEPTMSPFKVRGASVRTSERGPWSENPSGWLLAGYGPFRRASSAGTDALRMMVAPGHVARLVSLFREDASLAESVRWLQDIYLRRLEEKPGWGELERDVIRLLNDGLLPAGFRIERVDSDGLWVDHEGITLPLKAVSDGYRTVAALVLDIARHVYNAFGTLGLAAPDEGQDDGPVRVPFTGVVLIDEIDAHLHVSWQQKIGFWLKDHFPAVQFIVSTHSPFICQAADEDGLIRLPAPGEERTVEKITGELFKEVTNGSADEATMTELFGLEHTHSEVSERIRRQVAELEARLLREDGAPQNVHEQLSLLRQELPSSASATVDQARRLLSAEMLSEQ